MAKIVDEIGDDRRNLVADKIAARFGLGKGVARFWRASANFVFVCQQGNGRFFLRFNEDSERSRSLIESEVAVLNWLVAQGMPVAAPVLSPAGGYVETVATETGTFHGVLFTGQEGEVLNVKTMQAPQFRAWGKALGQLHSVLQNCPETLSAARPSLADNLAGAEEFLAKDCWAGQQELARAKAWAQGLSRQSEYFGLIHYDFEQDNLLWRQDGGYNMFDFDDCARYPWVADIAYALRDLFENEIDLLHPLFLGFIQGYREHKAISDQELSQLAMGMRVHDLVTYARLSRSTGLPHGYEGKLVTLNTRLMRIREGLLHGFAKQINRLTNDI